MNCNGSIHTINPDADLNALGGSWKDYFPTYDVKSHGKDTPMNDFQEGVCTLWSSTKAKKIFYVSWLPQSDFIASVRFNLFGIWDPSVETLFSISMTELTICFFSNMQQIKFEMTL